MSYAQVNGARFFYEVIGREAPLYPLVLTHGLGGDHTMWMNQVRAWRDQYQVVLWDVRGHGRSEVTEDGYSIDGFVADLYGLLQELDIERAHIGGLSMGGWISWAFALAHPEATASLVLSDSAGILEGLPDAERAEKRKLFEASAAVTLKAGRAPLVDSTLALMFSPEFLRQNSEAVQNTRRKILADPGIGYARTIQQMFTAYWETPPENVTEQLATLRVPSLVIAGELDLLTPLPTQRALAEAIPGARLEIIPGAGHVPNLEQPDRWNQLVSGFLAEVDSEA